MTLGCYYRNTGVGFMSMYGSVTDTQVFSRGLSVQEMVDITTCRSQQYLEIHTNLICLLSISISISRSFPEGDIISWDREPWRLRSPWNRSEAEVLDLARDVCAPKDRGYFMVPQKLTFVESRHICKKLTGAPISYTDKAEFEASAVNY